MKLNAAYRFVLKAADIRFSRKWFLKFFASALLMTVYSGARAPNAFSSTAKLKPRKKRNARTDYDIAVAINEDPSAATRKAVEALGGMGRFVRQDIVVIKPNIGWNRNPEQAANTNPFVVETLVRMCLEAGAKKVKVFDNPCNDARMTYRSSGIYDAVQRAKGDISYIDKRKFIPGEFPENSLMSEWPVYRDAVECDCFINAPVAKHHSLTRLTLSMKNLFGVCGGNRGQIHYEVDRKLTELTAFFKPDLTVIDACRILLRNGPTGGNPEDVERKNTVIASADPVLADSYAATLFGLKPGDIGHIRTASEAGLGSMNIAQARKKVINDIK
jgi:uncharacterized protein (DUF362 family)